ncbi:MAG: DUF2339 domain-containing protein, partial [Calditrichaeota bacterium]
MKHQSGEFKKEEILEYLKTLEARIARIESVLSLPPWESVSTREKKEMDKVSAKEEVKAESESLEFQIGEFWFAKVGIVVLVMGIAFLLTLPYHNLPPIWPIVIGYVLVGVLFLFSHLWRNSLSLLSRYLMGGGLVLMYFTTMRLYYFSSNPILTSKPVELTLLLLVTAFTLYIALRRSSVYLASLALTMGYVSAIVSDYSYFLFILLTILAVVTVYLMRKYEWYGLYIFSICANYLTHFIWFLNNPFLGKKLQLVSSPQANIYFVLLYLLIFALANLYRRKDLPETNLVIMSTFLTSVGGYFLYFLITFLKFTEQMAFSHILASVIFLVLAILFWLREKSRYSTFFYAMLGYGALSVAILAQFSFQDSFIWLCWQSVLVITTAIWFRSKFIIVANFGIYVLLFLAYLLIVQEVQVSSLNFGIVAMLSARILNWQREKLELKTEMMRNAYLVMAFFIFPYILYQIVPGGYVALSWIGVTLVYYLLSLLLKNEKYRWMALFNLLLTVLYVF